MADRLMHVVCYDIAAQGARARAAALLEARGVRVQKSVYELWLTSAQATRLGREIAALLAPGDSLRIYPMGLRGLRGMQSFGPGGAAGAPKGFHLF